MPRVNIFNHLTALIFVALLGGVVAMICNGPVYYDGQPINCTIIQGELNVYNLAVTDLAGLSSVTAVQSLSISSTTELVSLRGLDNLTSAGSISIQDNQKLLTLDGLESLMTVTDTIYIIRNWKLQNLTGLGNVKGNLSSSLYITDNYELNSLFGLEGLTGVRLSTTISRNPALMNLDGLTGLKTMTSGLELSTNYELTNITGLANVEGTVYHLQIMDNIKLMSLNGLQGISEVDTLSIYDNDLVTSLEPLSGLSRAGSIVLSLPNVDDLRGLRNVRGETQTLQITSCHKLKNMDGLQGLTQIGDLMLSSNDNLVNLVGLGNVSGNLLQISIAYNARLSDLSGLGPVTSVTYSTSMTGNTNMTSLAGLESLVSANSFTIADCDSLTDIRTLEGLVEISDLSITNNQLLSSLEGLTSLVSIGGQLQVTNNAALTSIGPLPALNTSVSHLTISHNPALTSLDGLGGITMISTSLEISDNQQLANISALRKAAGDLYELTILNNPKLVSLDGLDRITAASLKLQITDNDLLHDIRGLQHVRGSIHTVEIARNPTLLSLDGLHGVSQIGNHLEIVGNSALGDISALRNATNSAIQNLKVADNPFLLTLDGLQSLNSISYSITIASNARLQSLSALRGVSIQLLSALEIMNNSALASLDGLEGVTSVAGLEITGNPKLQNISALSGLDSELTLLQIGGPDDDPAVANQELQSICALCGVTGVGFSNDFIPNYSGGNDFEGYTAFQDWSAAGRPCSRNRFCTANVTITLTPCPSAAAGGSQTPSPSALAGASQTPSPSAISGSPSAPSATSSPTASHSVGACPSVTPSQLGCATVTASPSWNSPNPNPSCQSDCSINVTNVAQAVVAAGSDPEKLFALTIELSRLSSQLNVVNAATVSMLNQLGDAIGRSFGSATRDQLSESMAAATIIMEIGETVLNRSVVSSFVSGLTNGAHAMVQESDPRILTRTTANGTALLGKLARRAADKQQGSQLVGSAELLALAHAKSSAAGLVSANDITIGGEQGSMVSIADGATYSLSAEAGVTLPNDPALTSLEGSFILAPILWSNQSFPGNSLKNNQTKNVVTVSLLKADGTRQKVANLESPIRIEVPLAAGTQAKDIVCASYDHTAGAWSTDGCELDLPASTDAVALCLCSHLTDFSVLITTDGSVSEDSGSSGFSTGAIAGIAVGGAAALCACILLSCFLIAAVILLYHQRSKILVISGTPTNLDDYSSNHGF